MTKRNEKLKDKLNALKPSIPTNTRGEGGLQAGPAKARRRNTAAPRKTEDPPKVKVDIQEEKPAVPAVKPVEKTREKGSAGESAKEERLFTFGYAFFLPGLMQQNLACFTRMRDAMLTEANNMNSMYLKNCWQNMAACYEAALKACGFFSPCSFGKWPFKF